ncbi:SGNH/GDSL hydrolase family protein [Polyangium aurulentum]|uniref:SGNH/GDSL hydrolase family protein n=1 Tax=Polyangium aurulentum TaxID=2567896 RepID=UPI0010AE339D|nr:SGNH/GDSL hydrolase family protein [Polyangium aurulentum]UQA57407.1 SGNH/GDSL hydrolase family protein [Polyangium aurulentum]
MRSTFIISLIAPVLTGLLGACTHQAHDMGQPATPSSPAHAAPAPNTLASASMPAPGSKDAGPAHAPDPSAPAASVPAEEAPPIPPRSVVLHIGDSFLMAGFAQTLRPKMKELGANYLVHSQQSSYTTTWPLKLGKLVGDFHPDLVIINLGANEVELTDTAGRAKAVERMIKIIGDRPCVWVSPPLWRKDTGIIEIIRRHSIPCRYFDSDALAGTISRQHDLIHPDARGGEIWAEAFWKWLLAERAGAPKEGEKLPAGSGRHPVNPWRLKPAPAEEHSPRGKTAANP